MRNIRTALFGALGAGALVVGLLGSGLVALLSDTFLFQDNDLDTNELSPFDLLVGEIESGAPCDGSVVYEQGSVLSVFNDSVDINVLTPGEIYSNLPRYFCVQNSSSQPGDLVIELTAAAVKEAGPCSPGEAEAGDANCADAEPGELAVTWVYADGDATDDCLFGSGQFSGPLLAGQIPAGGICQVFVSTLVADVDIPDADAIARIQTEEYSADVTLTLQDAA